MSGENFSPRDPLDQRPGKWDRDWNRLERQLGLEAVGNPMPLLRQAALVAGGVMLGIIIGPIENSINEREWQRPVERDFNFKLQQVLDAGEFPEFRKLWNISPGEKPDFRIVNVKENSKERDRIVLRSSKGSPVFLQAGSVFYEVALPIGSVAKARAFKSLDFNFTRAGNFDNTPMFCVDTDNPLDVDNQFAMENAKIWEAFPNKGPKSNFSVVRP